MENLFENSYHLHSFIKKIGSSKKTPESSKILGLYQKLHTFTQGTKSGKSQKQNEGVFGRKKSNHYCYKRSYINGSREMIKSKRKYNSVNVSPGDISHDQTKSFSKMKPKKVKPKKVSTTMMEKKLKVIVGPLNSKASQSRKKKTQSKRIQTNSNFSNKVKNTINQSGKLRTTDRGQKRRHEDSMDIKNKSESKSKSPVNHLNVIRKYIQLEKKFGLKSKSIGRGGY
jgi:hypothetical protein